MVDWGERLAEHALGDLALVQQMASTFALVHTTPTKHTMYHRMRELATHACSVSRECTHLNLLTQYPLPLLCGASSGILMIELCCWTVTPRRPQGLPPASRLASPELRASGEERQIS